MKPITNFERITEYPTLIEGTEIDSVQHFTGGHIVKGCDLSTTVSLRGEYSEIDIQILWELNIIRIRNDDDSYCDYRLLNDYHIRTPKGFSQYLSELLRNFLGLKK